MGPARSRSALNGTILLVLAGVAHAAGAQSPADSARADSAARRLNAVTVTESRAAATTGGASVVLIKPEELRRSPAPLLEDALRESPFVHVRQNSRGEMELSVRGSDSRQVAVLMDGVPLSLGWDHRTDPSLVPITGAQNLVIVRGLASLLGGPNSIGGSIEVSHDNAFGALGTGRVWGGAGVDENGASVATIGAGREIAGAFSARGGVAYRRRQGFALAQGVPDASATRGLRTNSDLRQTDAFGTVRWNGARGRSVGLMVSGFTAERGVPPEEHITAPRLWRYPRNARVVAALSAKAGSFRTPLGWATLDVGAGYNAGRLEIETYSDRTYRSVTDAETGDERTMSGRTLFTHTLPGNARVKGALTLADVRYTETLFPDTAVDYQQQLSSAGTELEIPAGTRTTFASGVVYDRSSTPRTGGRTPGLESFDNVGWRAGVTHDLDHHWRLHSSVSRRSRFPSLRELYSGSLNRFAPNPALEPETLLGVEAGLTVDRSFAGIPDATVQLNLFHNDLDDAVVRITLPDRRFQRVNRDRIESSGAEVMAGVALGQNRARSVTLSADALVQRITIVDRSATGSPRRHAENNPERRGMVELGVPLPAGLRGFANARHIGRQYCLNADTGNEMTLDGQMESNLAAERRFVVSRSGSIRSLRALLSLDNAGNVAVYDQCGLSQPGRTLRLMFSFQ